MTAAWKATKRVPLEWLAFAQSRCGLRANRGPLIPREENRIQRRRADGPHRGTRSLVARAWRPGNRSTPAIDFAAQILCFRRVSWPQRRPEDAPDAFVCVAGFGECAPGDTPTDPAEREGFVKEHGYAWVGPEIEATMLKAMREALGGTHK
jgi:hypothetical protein